MYNGQRRNSPCRLDSSTRLSWYSDRRTCGTRLWNLSPAPFRNQIPDGSVSRLLSWVCTVPCRQKQLEWLTYYLSLRTKNQVLYLIFGPYKTLTLSLRERLSVRLWTSTRQCGESGSSTRGPRDSEKVATEVVRTSVYLSEWIVERLGCTNRQVTSQVVTDPVHSVGFCDHLKLTRRRKEREVGS